MLIYLCEAIETSNMFNTIDLYLGIFLIMCGLALSIFNFRRVVKSRTIFSSVLLSENIILMCIGIGFVSRSVSSLNPSNIEIFDMEQRGADLTNIQTREDMNCGFPTLLLGYGPLVVSLVNSSLSVIIDNYMHYKTLKNSMEKRDGNVVQVIDEDNHSERKFKHSVSIIWKKYFSLVTIALQWVIPGFTAIAMYPIGVKEITMPQARIIEDSCMAMLDLSQDKCSDKTNYTMDLSKYIQSPVNFFENHNNNKTNGTNEIDTVLSNVLRIINNFNNHSNFNFAMIKSLRQPKMDESCMKICYLDNKRLISYMLILGFLGYVIPITISTIILTRIYMMEVTRPKTKLYVTRELLCNILFWTPVMIDTLLSLILCAYSTHSVKTSMFNIIANVYQTIKNFMNAKYFKDNAIVPV